MVVSGHRESEQPIQRIWGDWPAARRLNRSGLVALRVVRQVPLEEVMAAA
jgi:hypothetical protein